MLNHQGVISTGQKNSTVNRAAEPVVQGMELAMMHGSFLFPLTPVQVRQTCAGRDMGAENATAPAVGL